MTTRTTQIRAAAVAAAAGAVLGLVGCSSTTTAGTATAPGASAIPQGTSSAAHRSGMDVRGMWEGTLTTCPSARSDSELPLGARIPEVQKHWPTDEQVDAMVAEMNPAGTVEFTSDHLLSLRVALADTRSDLTDIARSAVGETKIAEAHGQEADGIEEDAENVGGAWDTARVALVAEINDGRDHEQPADTADVLAQVQAARGKLCTGR